MIEIDRTRVPEHIAIIMDGNGRWANEQGKARSYGHQAGVETVHKVIAECKNLGVKYLTLYTFSSENWNRPADEVATLMGLVLDALEEELFIKNEVRFRVIGDMDRLPEAVRNRLQECMDHTEHFTEITMVVAISYSSRWEITETVKALAEKVKNGEINSEDITEDMVSQNLNTSFMPDPDLLIRTGGELRISNYLLWQIAYSELYFCDTYWPAFREEDLHKAIASYQQRQRRFGKTEAQVEKECGNQI